LRRAHWLGQKHDRFLVADFGDHVRSPTGDDGGSDLPSRPDAQTADQREASFTVAQFLITQQKIVALGGVGAHISPHAFGRTYLASPVRQELHRAVAHRAVVVDDQHPQAMKAARMRDRPAMRP